MAFCHKCGKELPRESVFCPSCGTPVATSKSSTVSGASTPPVGVMANYATLGDRAVAVVIDSVILFLVSLVFLIPLFFIPGIGYFPVFGLGFGLFFGPLVLAPWLLGLIYFTYFESTSGQTLGKGMVGIKVVDEASQRPVDMGRALIRNILRIIDWLPFLYIVGLVLVESQPQKKRLGDTVARTIVVKA